jgi:hypothetical protein
MNKAALATTRLRSKLEPGFLADRTFKKVLQIFDHSQTSLGSTLPIMLALASILPQGLKRTLLRRRL